MGYKLRKDVYLYPPDTDLLNRCVDEGWFDDDPSNWQGGYGRGLAGKVAFRADFLDSLHLPDDKVKVVGVYRGAAPCGFVTISPLSEQHKTVAIRMYLHRAYRGLGIAPTALFKLLKSIFAAGAYRVEIELLRLNKSAIKWLKHSGFTQEGIRRGAHWMDNNVFDTVVMRMLRFEFDKQYKDMLEGGA